MAGTPPPAAASVNYPAHRYLTFFGQINPPSSSNLRLHLSNLVHQKARQVTLLFASGGGSTDDGMALFTYLRALPFELTIHAVGLVGSMGIPVFLAGKNRIASQNARFFFHDYTSNFVQYNGPMTREQQMGNTLLLTDAVNWTKDILKANTTSGSGGGKHRISRSSGCTISISLMKFGSAALIFREQSPDCLPCRWFLCHQW